MNQVYSTREMAQMCGVNESTIKRWADSGKLRCMKTPGGHRKFKIKDVLTFFNEYGFEALGVSAQPGAEPEPGNIFPMLVLKHDLPGLARLYLDSALQMESREAATVLFRLLTAGFSLSEICDGVVTPALEEIGERWSDGRLTILEEHFVSMTTCYALNRMSEMIPRAVPNGKAALCCPVDSEAHTIGCQMAGLMLESLGWNTRVAAAPTPAGEVADYLRRYRPDLLCVSIVKPLEPESRDDLENIVEVARESGTHVVVGGRAATDAGGLTIEMMGHSVKDLETYARNLAGKRKVAEEKVNEQPAV